MSSGVRIAAGSLGVLTRLGAGGQGVVYSTPLKLRHMALPLVFKEYKASATGGLDVSVLEAMPTYLETLPFADGMALLSQSAWPCRLVEDAGAVKGFVMPAIPGEFYVSMSKAAGVSRQAAEFQHLLNGDSFLARRQIQLTDRHRYELLVELTQALSTFHRHGITVGDLSPKNLLFSIDPLAKVFFVDCDAMRFQGRSVVPQLETPGWEVRAVNPGEELATVESDAYKLGLLALRLLAGDQSTRDPGRLPVSVPKSVRCLIGEALQRRPAARPEPGEWASALTTAAAGASTTSPRIPTETTPPAATATRPTAPRARQAASPPPRQTVVQQPPPPPQRTQSSRAAARATGRQRAGTRDVLALWVAGGLALTILPVWGVGRTIGRGWIYDHVPSFPEPRPDVPALAIVAPDAVFGALLIAALLGLFLLRPPWGYRRLMSVAFGVVLLGVVITFRSAPAELENAYSQEMAQTYRSGPIDHESIGGACTDYWIVKTSSGRQISWLIHPAPPGRAIFGLGMVGAEHCRQVSRFNGWSHDWTVRTQNGGFFSSIQRYSRKRPAIVIVEENTDRLNKPKLVLGINASNGRVAWKLQCPRSSDPHTSAWEYDYDIEYRGADQNLWNDESSSGLHADVTLDCPEGPALRVDAYTGRRL
jgi:hypothetical protein